MKKKVSDPFYSTQAWKRARRARLMLDNGMCSECMAEMERGERMKPMRATMVHHVLPITERPDLALDITNMRSLCDLHHARAHPEKGGGGQAKARRKAPARMRVIKV